MNLPDPGNLSWQDDALCLRPNITTELFFPEVGSAKGQKARAKAVCKQCPVRETCLDYAIEVPLGSGGYVKGIWGGTTELQRTNLRKKRANDE